MAVIPHTELRRVEPAAAPAADFGSAHSWQGLVGFLAGGLLTAVLMLGPAAVSATYWVELAGRFGGFVVGGLVGGAALAWGSPARGGWRSGALGFGLGMLIPAFLAGPAVAELLSFDKDRDPVALALAAFIAFSTGYGIGGALGMSFVVPRLFWTAGWRFFFAGGLGGLLCAWGSRLAGDPMELDTERAVLSTGVVLAGHLTPFVLGGWLAGRALDLDRAAQEKKARKRPRDR
ncbi:MAG: hypothetical protein GC160_10930 [Acidobacteria bacterium]|nr:hypothetical protein [Acidobacteriota bacterium]